MAITQRSDRNRRVIVIDDGTGTKKFRTVGSRSHCQTGSFGSFGGGASGGEGEGKRPITEAYMWIGIIGAPFVLPALLPFSIILGGVYLLQEETLPTEATEATQCDPHEGIY